VRHGAPAAFASGSPVIGAREGEATPAAFEPASWLFPGNEIKGLNQKCMIKSLAAITAQFLDGGIPAFTLPLNAFAFRER
jgi:hypothetical protein